MAEFEVKCPHCGVELIVPEEWAGMNGECPSCKKSFTITLKTRKLPDPRKKSTGNCNLVIDNYEAEKRIDVIAAIRELKNTGLSEILNLIDHLPATLLENVSAEQAEEAKRKLEEIGAYVHLENRKSSAPRAEKKKNTAPRPSVKQQIRHNNQKKKARPVQSADSSESSSKGDDDDSSNGFNDILSGLCFGGGLAVILFLVEACSGKGSIIPPLLFWIIIPVFWLIYIACGGLKLKSFSKNLIGGTIAFIMTSMLMNPESAIRSLLHSISSSDNRKTTVASADKSSVSNASEKQTSDSSNSNAESKRVQTTSSSNSNAESNVAVSEIAGKAPMENSQVKISVKVEPLAPGTGYSARYGSYDIAVDYKLYADGECVATRTTNRTSWFFSDISVKRGAKITAEIYEKNKHGAVVNVRNGPVKDVYASKEGAFMEIVCW